MASNPVSPEQSTAPATPVAPVTPAAAPPSAPATKIGSPGHMKAMIGDILNEPDGGTADTVDNVQPTVEVTPPAPDIPSPPPETAPADATVPAEPAAVVPVEESPFDTQEPVAFEQRPEGIAEKTWKTVYPAYQFSQEMKKSWEEGGLGFEPTIDDLRQHYDAFSDRVSMEEDFASGDPQAAANFVTKWFGQLADGTYRPNAEIVAANIPGALAQANPQALTNLVAALPQALARTAPEVLSQFAAQLPALLANTNQQALGQLSHPILSSYGTELWNRWSIETNPQIKEALYAAAQVLHKDTNGQFRNFDQTGKPIEPTVAQPDRSALDAERAEIQRAREAINKQNQEMQQARLVQWQNQLVSEVNSQVEPLYELALKPLKNGQSATGPYNAAKRDFAKQVTEQVQRDPKWQVYKNLVQRALRTSSPDDSAAVVEFYKGMATRAITNVRGKFLQEWGVAAKQQSDVRHAELASVAKRVEPSSAGAPAQPVLQTGKPQRQRGESQEEFLKRTVRSAMAS